MASVKQEAGLDGISSSAKQREIGKAKRVDHSPNPTESSPSFRGFGQRKLSVKPQQEIHNCSSSEESSAEQSNESGRTSCLGSLEEKAD